MSGLNTHKSITQWKQGAVAGSHMVTLVSWCQLTVQTYSGWSSCEKPSQTEFEPNQTNTNGFNRFWFQKFWLKPNSLVSGLGKNGLIQTRPNFSNTSIHASNLLIFDAFLLTVPQGASWEGGTLHRCAAVLPQRLVLHYNRFL